MLYKRVDGAPFVTCVMASGVGVPIRAVGPKMPLEWTGSEVERLATALSIVVFLKRLPPHVGLLVALGMCPSPVVVRKFKEAFIDPIPEFGTEQDAGPMYLWLEEAEKREGQLGKPDDE
jgi:hypothetical protein